MIAKINSCGVLGIDGYIVTVEVDISNGLPAFEMVGLPDATVKESRERIRATLKNMGLIIPSKKITVNLAPANLKKEGAYYDVPIAVGILFASEQLFIEETHEYAFFGELSLDGEIRRLNGALPMVISAYQNGIKKIFVPKENVKEAAIVKEVEVFGVSHLSEILEHFNGDHVLTPEFVDVDKLFNDSNLDDFDFADVKGQENVKRALEVAAAGGHNCLMIGPPGSGKTMLSQRLSSILPAMSFDEALEVAKVHSIAGLLSSENPIARTRPFRNPHHTISAAGLSGGGAHPKPGEISLSHNGVLFLDELPEFRKDALEVMRQPLEDGVVTISRASGTLQYPCNIMLVASMNPCPCGYFGDNVRTCSCAEQKRQKYLTKISGPLLDRIDLHIEVAAVKYDDLETTEKSEKSSDIRDRVNRAREIQRKRYENNDTYSTAEPPNNSATTRQKSAKSSLIYSNSQLKANMMDEHCALSEDCGALLKAAFERLGLSARAHNRILKVARTIADLAGAENIEVTHLAEAIQYRSLDRKFWGA